MAENVQPLCLVRGSVNIDEFFHVPTVVRPGETLSSTHFERRGGGKGANQASAVAKAGGRAKLIGAVGEDGKHLLQDMKSVGVDISDVVVSDKEPTGRAIIQLTPEGENCIILHKGANYLTTPRILALPPSIPDLTYTHLLLQNEIPWECTLAYLLHARQIGATAVFNPSPMPSVKQLRTFPWNHLEWLLVNEGEVEDLLRALVPERSRTSKDVEGDRVDSARRLLAELHQRSLFSPSLNVICTLGGAGLLALLHENTSRESAEIVYLPAAKLEGEVLDTTGAGDCFTGYFVAGLMQESASTELGATVERDGIVRALERAVQAAGLCVQRPGAVDSIPFWEEVEHCMLPEC